MGTPPLAAGTEISVRLAESAFDEANGETKIAGFIETGAAINLNLRNSENIKLGQRKSDTWTIVKIGMKPHHLLIALKRRI